MRKLILLTTLCLFSFAIVYAQGIVRGKVTDANGENLPGASVIVKGTAIGTVTDINGNYSLSNVPSNATLVYSFVGMQDQEIPVNGRSSINLALQESTQLEEVVVTGIGTATDKSKLAISVESVREDALTNVPSTDFTSAISGKVPGALIQSISGQPGQQANIVLRGINSVTGTQPMILIDGVEINTDNLYNGSVNNLSSRLADLDLTNVDRVEVVQGAAAATIYGAQGANGVIQIFTKEGKIGETQITAGTSITINNFINNGDLKLADKHHYSTNSEGYILDGSGNALAPDSATGIWPSPIGTVDGTTQSNNPFKEKTWDNVALFFKDNVLTSNSYVNISGGSDKATYSFSGSYLNQESLINGIYKRGNIRANLGFNLAKDLKFKNRTNLNFSNNTSGGITGQDNVYSGLGTALQNPQYINLEHRDALGNYVARPAGDNSVNPLFTNAYRHYNANVARIIQNNELDWKINKIFRLNGRIGYDYYRYDFEDVVENQEELLTDGLPPDDGKIEKRVYNGSTLNGIIKGFITLNFEEDFGISAPLTSIIQLAYDYRKEKYNRVTSTGTGLPTFTKDVNLNQASDDDITQYEEESITYGYLVNAKFDWSNLAGISFGFRTDYSSAFGKGSEPFTFPRADFYFNVAKLDSWKYDWWYNFKVRVAYGKAGIQPGAFNRIRTLSPVSIDNSSTLITPSELQNPDLNVTVSSEMEAGVDLGFSNNSSEWFNRVGVSFTYWDRSSNDVIRAIDIAPSSGATSLLDNTLTIESSGIQFSINSTPIQNENIKWNSIINFGSSKNTVTDISNDKDIALGNNHVIREGAPVGAFIGNSPLTSLSQTKSDGTPYIATDDRDDYEVGPRGFVVNKSSKTVQFTSEKVLIGDPTPDFNMSFINDVTLFKYLTFGFQLDWIKGADIYNQTKQWLYRDLIHKDVTQNVTIDGTSAPWTNFYQSMYSTNVPNKAFVEDGSYLRLRSISTSYDFARFIDFCSKVKLTLSAHNLFTITNYSGFDPEAFSNLDESIERGLDQYAFPNTKGFSFKLDIGF